MVASQRAKLLDMNDLDDARRRAVTIDGQDHTLRSVLLDLRVPFECMQVAGLLDKKDSLGFAMTEPGVTDFTDIWDVPSRLAWFVGGWGPEIDYYDANALRKLRMATREGRDSYDIELNARELIQNEITEDLRRALDNGLFIWGDFAFGGAIYVTAFGISAWVAVSCYKKDEDVVAAAMIFYHIALQIWRSRQAA